MNYNEEENVCRMNYDVSDVQGKFIRFRKRKGKWKYGVEEEGIDGGR